MNAAIVTFRDLDAWQVSMELVLLIYPLSARLPVTERYGLSSQICRAAVSIPANIAEGHASGQPRRYIAHLRIALGSLAELSTHLEIASRLGFLSGIDLKPLWIIMSRVRQLLHSLLRALSRQPERS